MNGMLKKVKDEAQATLIKADIEALHNTLTLAQFDALGAMVLASWKVNGIQDDVIKGFKKEYLEGEMRHWFRAFAADLFIEPNNNDIESHFKVWKHTFYK